MLKAAGTVEELCRQLPQLDRWLAGDEGRELLRTWDRELVVVAARTVLTRLREQAQSGSRNSEQWRAELDRLSEAIAQELRAITRPSLRRVINATGVILQTNLGRAPLSAEALRAIEEAGRDYCNIEFDLDSGARGRRDVHAEDGILRLLALRGGLRTNQNRAAMVVNNCAAATFLVLNSLAEGGEVLVSRGELVEIGGGFRIPEILRKSGAILREVGTTNRTRLADYVAAITPETRLILRVHRSNFRMEGFTGQPSLDDLIALGAEVSLPVFEDQGTGCVVDLEAYGFPEESNWVRSATSEAALVAASGDKLLGGPQCGLLVGRRSLIERIRTNPLARALRVDKLAYAALQATLLAYLTGQEASIPAIAMLRMDAERIRARCDRLVLRLASMGLAAETVPAQSIVGGGTTPGVSLPSFAVALRHPALSEEELAAAMHRLEPPVIARTQQGRVLLDLRTVPPQDDDLLAEALSKLEFQP